MISIQFMGQEYPDYFKPVNYYPGSQTFWIKSEETKKAWKLCFNETKTRFTLTKSNGKIVIFER